MTARRCREGGFALLEALAVLALSALFVLTMVIIAGLVTRNSEIASARADEMERLATGLSALRRDIDAAIRAPATATGEQALFFGEPGRMGLAVGRHRFAAGAGDALVLITASMDPGGGALVRTSRPLGPADSFAGGPWHDPVPLISGPWRFQFSYGAVVPTGLQWRRDWPQSTELPTAVRIDFADVRPGGSRPPPLIIPIRVNSRLACAEGTGLAC